MKKKKKKKYLGTNYDDLGPISKALADGDQERAIKLMTESIYAGQPCVDFGFFPPPISKPTPPSKK